MSGVPMNLKIWTLLFDARREKIEYESIWVRILGLPMQFWSMERFRAIGNYLGHFINVDMSFKVLGLMKVTQILVNLDVRASILEEMKINTTSGTCT